jgi:ABC-2 type transport system ATP-binding protein
MITLENVSKSFRRTKVLNDLSLTFGEGDRIALIGSNGAGKTTLIRCILGQYVHQGTLTVNGLIPRKNREAVLKTIGFVPQIAPPLKMPVSELLRFAAGTAGISVQEIEAICERLEVEFGELRNRPFVKLSGGQKQKILVAIAIARKPGLIIMDEPTANLDPKARQVLFDLLSERGNLPVLISSHRLEEVAGLVNRIIELDRGRVVLDDSVADSGDMATRLPCRITLARKDQAFANAMGEWHFTTKGDSTIWLGEVAGADRLRFFGVLARYSGLIDGFELGNSVNSKGADQ